MPPLQPPTRSQASTVLLRPPWYLNDDGMGRAVNRTASTRTREYFCARMLGGPVTRSSGGALAVALAPGPAVRSRSPWRPGQRRARDRPGARGQRCARGRPGAGQRCARGHPGARVSRALAVALARPGCGRSRSPWRRPGLRALAVTLAPPGPAGPRGHPGAARACGALAVALAPGPADAKCPCGAGA
jgi:hypothetical protein